MFTTRQDVSKLQRYVLIIFVHARYHTFLMSLQLICVGSVKVGSHRIYAKVFVIFRKWVKTWNKRIELVFFSLFPLFSMYSFFSWYLIQYKQTKTNIEALVQNFYLLTMKSRLCEQKMVRKSCESERNRQKSNDCLFYTRVLRVNWSTGIFVVDITMFLSFSLNVVWRLSGMRIFFHCLTN